MDKQRRKELVAQYKEMKTYMGIVQIKNTVNGKIFVMVSPNLKNRWLTIRSQLEMGRFFNPELQKDWLALGADAFEYEVLEEKEADDIEDKRWALKQMEKQWLKRLQPFGDKGYNKMPKE